MSSTAGHDSRSQTQTPASGSPRSAWIDNVRTMMIVLVLNMHACVTYSHVGGWYIKEQPEPNLAVKIPFLFWQGHLQAFFMGLLFFLAGVFAHRSLTRRGSRGFLKERVVRLGFPALLYMLLIHPFMIYVMLSNSPAPGETSLATLYVRYLSSGRVLSGNGPLWFALALLAFSAVFAGWRGMTRKVGQTETAVKGPPSSAALMGFGAVLVVTTFLIRTVQPIGTSVFNFQLCFFPQYIAAFAVGVMAGKHGWLEALVTSRRARVAGWLGILGGPLALALVIWLGGPLPEAGPNPYEGGWNPQAFGLATWEQLAGLGVALGVLGFFHSRGNASGATAAWLSSRAFAVYVLHAPVLVALTFALRPIAADPFTRAGILTVTGLIASFLVADISKRIPGLRAIL